MTHRSCRLFGALFFGLAAAVACAHSIDDSASDDGRGFPNPGSGGFGASGAPGSLAGSGGRPAERENESRYLAPVATGKYLWMANPLSGRIAMIDAMTLSVTLETAGNGPRQVVGLPENEGRVGALVLNERSDDATVFRVDESGTLSKHGPLRTHSDANAWTVSPSGSLAIAWTDALLREGLDALDTFQDITVLSLEPGNERARSLSVGVRPSAFAFSETEDHAYAVTEQGISVISLRGTPEVSDLIHLSDDPLENPSTRDVSFAPDASYALVRTEGTSQIGIVSLPSGARAVVHLEGQVTDVDLSPGGDFAFAVLGYQSVVVKVPLSEAEPDPSSFERLNLSGQAIGAIALNTDATAAVLYSTVTEPNRVSLADITRFEEAEQIRRYDLIAPVTAVFPAPDPRFAVAFQGQALNSTKAGAFSLLMLNAPRAPTIVATDASPTQIAFSPSGTAALVTVRSDALQTFGAYLIDLSSQQTDFVALASPPEAAGVVAVADRAYVAQTHPEGRITFISMRDKQVQTLTGFELAARIRNE